MKEIKMSTFVKKLSNALLRMPPLQAIHLLGIRGKSAVKISNELAKGAKPCSSLEIASMIESPADFLSREHFAEISPETKRQIAWRLSRRNIPETVENAPIRQGDNEDTISSLNRGNTFCSPISETNPDLVGGKGASLGVLANIPEIMTIDSFSVNSIAFDAFIRHNDLEGMITKLERLSEEWIRLELTKTSENITEQNTAQQTLRERILNCSKKIYDKFLTADIPNSIRNEIISQYRLLSARQGKELSKVAVRSSATAEDLPTASFAGMQETLLNQVGDEAVVNAVRAVWASYMGNYEQDDIGNTAFSDKSVFYRNEQRALILLSEYLGEGLDSLNYEHRKDKVAKRGIDFGEIEERMNRNTVFKHLKVKLAVVVQKMGEAYAAGVVFSVDTKTGAPIIKIEANYGLGETVVAGKASVDNWKVFRHNLRIFDWRLGEKSVQIVPDVAQGIVTIPCPAELRGKLCLTDEIVVDIARQAIVIEEYYQKHKGARFLDMEYVVDKNGRIYFVQARPETLWSRRISQPGLLKVSQLSFDKKQEEKATLIFHNGFGASPGVAVGRVRVCPSLEDAYKQFADDSSMGDILVTTKTTPEWVPVAMGKAGAFITDIGGAFNHAAVVGREFGKPVIVDARQATKDLLPWDGKCVSVNAGNANIYKGRLPVIQRVDEYNLHRPLSFEPQTKPIKFDRVYEEQGLVTKPRHPVRALQKALYLSAFELIKERHEWDYHLVTIDDDRASALRLFFTNWPMGDKEINQRILEHIERNRGSITAAGEHDLDQILMDLVPKEFREFVKGIWRGRYSYPGLFILSHKNDFWG
ncbi:hypothetical protein COT42_08740 [Candidatus Saganbacteria bacterium CG08_land_8_20_14_0_20_45_16]|uniref:Phosphoenolpyruvate synthase n=1 Tax=Candidatus Saganbacteria bacterium CG08_land_8_20_14_0_20_45_16 TaxID=2014293 RepID=A0A2H0XTE2_UNCSA|nr:MAG: hypothetical protein COT42_08740 [Candidatus Saganbacteria bacterium CG08_land_8_20_14_0_20_45_16]